MFLHARMSNSRRELDQAVEPPAATPGASLSIGIERHIDQAWPDRLAGGRIVAETTKSIRAITVNEDIGTGKQSLETFSR